MSAGNERRKPAEIERDRRNIARMYLAGRIQADIADELGISQATVSRDLKAVQAEWKEARINDIDERKRQELAKIDNLELEYWDAWRRSCENAEIETTKAQAGRGSEGPDRIEKTKRVEGQTGDPRFLTGVMTCINKRCELLGLNAPVKNEMTGKDGGALEIVVKYADGKRNDTDPTQ